METIMTIEQLHNNQEWLDQLPSDVWEEINTLKELNMQLQENLRVQREENQKWIKSMLPDLIEESGYRRVRAMCQKLDKQHGNSRMMDSFREVARFPTYTQ